MGDLVNKTQDSTRDDGGETQTNSQSGTIAIMAGPFRYHAVTATDKAVSADEIGQAIANNLHRMLDTTGKYDLKPSDLY